MHDDIFRKLTKKEKLALLYSSNLEGKEILKALFIPIQHKISGFAMNAVFLQLNSREWVRGGDYDCYSFEFEGVHRYRTLKGDFEYGGICFFLELYKATYDYGNRFVLIDTKASTLYTKLYKSSCY